MISVGIDIGSFSVKVARIEGSAKGFKVLSLDDYPLPQDPSKDTTLDVLEALRDIQTRHAGPDVHFVVAAEQNHISSRRRSFPFKERHKILKSLPFELEDDIPLSIENAVFDAKLTHFEDGMSQVLALACPKEHIIHQVQRLDDAGLEPSILSTEGIAAGNLFEDWLESPHELNDASEFENEAPEATLVVHIGHSKTICTIIKHGYTLDHFTIDWGGRDLAKTISLKYSIHYVEALKELRQKAFILTHNEGVTREQITLSDILKTEVDQMANSLRLAIAKMETEYRIKISQGILCGGVSQLRNLGPYLTQKLEIAFNRLSQIENLENLDFGSNPNNEISHIVSIGLAAEGVKRPKNPAVNFLKGEFAAQNENMQILIEQWKPVFYATAALFGVLLVWGFARTMVAESNLAKVEDLLNERARKILNDKRPNSRKIKKFINDQEIKAKSIATFESLQYVDSALDVLNNISKLAPPKSSGDLNITNMSVRNGDVNVVGYANSPALVNQFKDTLKNVSAAGVVNEQVPPGGLPQGQRGFNLTIQVDRAGGNN